MSISSGNGPKSIFAGKMTAALEGQGKARISAEGRSIDPSIRSYAAVLLDRICAQSKTSPCMEAQSEEMNDVKQSIFHGFVKCLIAKKLIDPSGKSEREIYLDAANFVDKNRELVAKSDFRVSVSNHVNIRKVAVANYEAGDEKRAIHLLWDAIFDVADVVLVYALHQKGYSELQIEILLQEWSISSKVFYVFAVVKDSRPPSKIVRLLENLNGGNRSNDVQNFLDLTVLYSELEMIEHYDVFKGVI
jgi:hypothetical protein